MDHPEQERYDALGKQITTIRAVIADQTAMLGDLEGERQEVADRLAEAATSDADLVRWSNTPVGREKLQEAAKALDSCFDGVDQWKRTKLSHEPGEVRLMVSLGMYWEDKVCQRVEEMADALVEFHRRFGSTPVPDGMQSSRILWVRMEDLPEGRVPVHLLGAEHMDLSLEFDPETRIALLTDDRGGRRPYAGLLPQVLVEASRRIHNIT